MGSTGTTGGTGGMGAYSDNSHGTYGQPPMQPSSTFDVGGAGGGGPAGYHIGPGEVFDASAYGAGAAGVGAAMARSRSQKALQGEMGGPGSGGHDPYPAFAGGAYEMREVGNGAGHHGAGAGGGGYADYDILQAAGLAGASGDPYAIARGQSLRNQNNNNPALSRNGSQSSQNALAGMAPPLPNPYAQQAQFDNYYNGGAANTVGTGPRNAAPGQNRMSRPTSSYVSGGDGDADPYGGYSDFSPRQSVVMPNPHHVLGSGAGVAGGAKEGQLVNLDSSPATTESGEDYMKAGHHGQQPHVVGEEDEEDEEDEEEEGGHGGRVLRVRYFLPWRYIRGY